MDTEDTTVDTTATLTDTVTTEARGLPHLNLKPMLMLKLPLMPGTDITVWDTVDTTDTVWDTTVMDTVWDTVDTTDTDIPVPMVTTDTTTARGLLMPTLKPNPKPKLILLLMLGTDTMAVTDTDMAEDTMVDTTDTLTDTDTTVKKLF